MIHTLYNSLFEATCNVFQLMLDLTDITDKPTENFKHDQVLNISIGVIGDLKGEIIYRFPNDTSLGIVHIMSGMEMETVDEFVTSAISEIANIISGNVLTALAEHDLKCDILPPVLKDSDVAETHALQTGCCIATAVGEICLDIRLNSAQ